MAVTDLVISFFAGSSLTLEMFKGLNRPYVFFQPNIGGRQYAQYLQSVGYKVENIWNQARAKDMTLGRVALLGFSEGCTGVRETLKCSDASGIDTVIPCDGIHAMYTDPKQKTFPLAYVEPYVEFAKLAMSERPSVDPNVKMLCIPHSSVVPSYASTTETAATINMLLGLGAGSLTPGWPATLGERGIETDHCDNWCLAAMKRLELESVLWPGALPLDAKVGGGVVTPMGWSTVRPSDAATNFMKPETFTWKGFGDGWTDKTFANNYMEFGWRYPTKLGTRDPTGNRDHVFLGNMVLPYLVQKLLVARWNGGCGDVFAGLGQAQACQQYGTGFHDQDLHPIVGPSSDAIVQVPQIPGTEDPTLPEAHFHEGVSALGKAFWFISGVAAGYHAAKWSGLTRRG